MKLDLALMRLVLLLDASFATAPGPKSLIAYVISMMDKSGSAYTVHYASSQCHHVLRSLMAAQVHVLVLALDMGMVVVEPLSELLHLNVEMEACVDSRTLFNFVTGNSNTAERRIQIDALALKESYKKERLWCIDWITGK